MFNGEPGADDRVLLVDDESGLLVIHQRVLTAAGFSVDVCGSAEEAASKLRSGQKYSTVVTDLVMPGMSGIDLLEIVHELDAELPVVILTGRPSLGSTLAAIEHHSFRYLIKPVLPATLGETVRLASAGYRLSKLKTRALEVCQSEGWGTNDSMLQRAFEGALDNLYMVYQPIVDPIRGDTFGYEALVRSRDAVLSSPDVLLAAAEKLGRMQELGRVIRDRIAKDIRDAPLGCSIFVNLHASDLVDPALYAPESPLCRHATRVVLEITERRSLDGVPDLRSRLTQLRDFGFRIAVDDLGAGYAGLSCFNVLEPEIVKLDMSLVRNIDSAPRKRALVEMMVGVCIRDFGIQVVCEGVETVAERDLLIQIGAPLLQGYLFGRPEPEFRRPEGSDFHRFDRSAAI